MRDKIKEIIIVLGIVTLLTGGVLIPSTKAAENEYGIVEAWVRTRDDDGNWGKWQNATVHKTLKVHEPFKVKVRVASKVECATYTWLSRAGTVHAYEIINGDTSRIGIKDAIIKEMPINSSERYEWTIRPTGNWTEGTAALNIRTQFSTMEDDKFVDFTIIAAYIEPEEWEGDATDDNGTGDNENATGNDGNGIPGFEGMLLGLSIIVAIMTIWVRKGVVPSNFVGDLNSRRIITSCRSTCKERKRWEKQKVRNACEIGMETW